MSPAPEGALGALEGSGLGQAMRQWLWLYPSVEIVHIAGIALLFGSIAVLDLRLLGLSRSIPVRRLARHPPPPPPPPPPPAIGARLRGALSRAVAGRDRLRPAARLFLEADALPAARAAVLDILGPH